MCKINKHGNYRGIVRIKFVIQPNAKLTDIDFKSASRLLSQRADSKAKPKLNLGSIPNFSWQNYVKILTGKLLSRR